MTDKLALLKQSLEAMVTENETVTTRAVIRRMADVFKNPADITRNAQRRALVGAYASKQEHIRNSIERSAKRSSAELERLLASKNAEIVRMQNEKKLLIASHRAMILATSQLGGFDVWKRFFERYQATVDSLDEMKAVPNACALADVSRDRT